MATHSSVLAWRIPRTGEPGGLPSMESRRVGHDWSDLAAAAAAAVFHWLNGCESEWTVGVGDGQGGPACCHSWGRKSWTWLSGWTELNWTECFTLWTSYNLFIHCFIDRHFNCFQVSAYQLSRTSIFVDSFYFLLVNTQDGIPGYRMNEYLTLWKAAKSSSKWLCHFAYQPVWKF